MFCGQKRYLPLVISRFRSTFSEAAILLIAGPVFFLASCSIQPQHLSQKLNSETLPIIIDSDANNELDDQHALAYAFFNSEFFDIKAVTVNSTRNGGGIEGQFDEANRVMRLCQVDNKIPLLKGAEGSYVDIRKHLNTRHDGFAAVDFIIQQARSQAEGRLILVPIGKLTNIALALEKAPDIEDKIRVVWLGSNFPAPGEYNLQDDVASVNRVLASRVPFEMVTVRYDEPSGTAAVKARLNDILSIMPGRGPLIKKPIQGRHGGFFDNFGDYSVNLFKHVGTDRSMYDMAALAILKEPSWGAKVEIPAPMLIGDEWKLQPDNKRRITIWENFNAEAIMKDFYASFD